MTQLFPSTEPGRKKLYGGNTKRIIKKHAHFNLDGVYYRWDAALFRISLMAALKPGEIAFIPYTREWGVVEKVEPHKAYLRNYFLSSNMRGWWIDEVILSVRGAAKDSLYYVYDIEHWNMLNIPEPEKIVQFNRQVGLPDDYLRPPHWQPWF